VQTAELLTLTKTNQNRSVRTGQSELANRQNRNWGGLKGEDLKTAGCNSQDQAAGKNRPTFHRVFLAKNKVVLES